MKKECNKCCGTGIVDTCKHVMGGICFSCNGTGIKHTKKRTKITSIIYIVSSGRTTYRPFKTECEAVEFSKKVECMHLEPIKITKKESIRYEFKKVVA